MPTGQSNSATFDPGSPVVVNGRKGLVLRTPTVFVMFEDGGISDVPIGALTLSPSEPAVAADDFARAQERWPVWDEHVMERSL